MSGLAANLHHAWRLFDLSPDQDRRGSIFADKVLAECPEECPAGCFFLIHRDQDGTCPECGTVFYAPAK
jgi:NAD-dependent dihydropyrimidine dehydrogenase PreA subunit